MRQNTFAAGALPQTTLGELISFPVPELDLGKRTEEREGREEKER